MLSRSRGAPNNIRWINRYMLINGQVLQGRNNYETENEALNSINSDLTDLGVYNRAFLRFGHSLEVELVLSAS